MTDSRHGAARRRAHGGTLARLAALAVLLLLAAGASGCGPPSPPPRPEQPIAFSHAAHAEEGLECLRCHNGADRGRRAGLTPLRTCVQCHRRVIPDHPEVIKLMAAWEAETPVPWRRINWIPAKSMVQFHHAAHLHAEIDCSECHGDVATMAVAEPVINVADMGWCLECHRQRQASDDCLTCHH